jgi:preprotein translocase subunit YajC
MWNLAEEAAAQAPGWSAYLIQYSPLIIMFAILYFLLIRPQQKRQKTRNAMLNALKKNDKIVTIGGLHGTIVELTDDSVVIRVNDATKMTFDRSAISSVKPSDSEN